MAYVIIFCLEFVRLHGHGVVKCNGVRFRKFERFRKLVIVDFSVLVKLTINTDTGRSLPPPKKFAADLELYAIRCIKEWNEEFGKVFKDEFGFVLKYLSKYKKVGGSANA